MFFFTRLSCLSTLCLYFYASLFLVPLGLTFIMSMVFPNEDASPWLRMSHVSEFNELDAKCLLLVFFFSWNSQ